MVDINYKHNLLIRCSKNTNIVILFLYNLDYILEKTNGTRATRKTGKRHETYYGRGKVDKHLEIL